MKKLYTSVAFAALLLAAAPVAHATDAQHHEEAMKAHDEVTKFLSSAPASAATEDIKASLKHVKDTVESVKEEAASNPAGAAAQEHAAAAAEHTAKAEEKLADSEESKVEAEAHAAAAHSHAVAAAAVIHDGMLHSDGKLTETTQALSDQAKASSEHVEDIKSEPVKEKKHAKLHGLKMKAHAIYANFLNHIKKHQSKLKSIAATTSSK